MIARFFYHGFWNFYDYLGSLTLFGTLYAILSFALIVASFSLSTRFPAVMGILMPVLMLYMISVPTAAGIFYYTGKASRDVPARWPDIWHGIRAHWKSVAIILGLWMLVEVVLLVNINFYFHVQQNTGSSGLRIFLFGAMALVGWITAAWILILPPWLAAATSADNPELFKEILRRMAVGIALTPGCWLVLSLFILLLIASVVYLRITVIFVLPVLASLSQTAYRLGVQYSGFLVEARDEMGIGHTLRKYKVRANELATNWEYRQVRRTFKELVRPWEY